MFICNFYCFIFFIFHYYIDIFWIYFICLVFNTN